MEYSSLRHTGKAAAGKVYKGSLFSSAQEKKLDDAKYNNKGRLTGNEFIKYIQTPGPGCYQINNLSSTSFSKKGYGSLIKSSPRFKKILHKTLSPGPGTYKVYPRFRILCRQPSYYLSLIPNKNSYFQPQAITIRQYCQKPLE
jgi:Sperm-tail PG-rich repeat